MMLKALLDENELVVVDRGYNDSQVIYCIEVNGEKLSKICTQQKTVNKRLKNFNVLFLDVKTSQGASF